MALYVNTNTSALNAFNNLSKSQADLSKSLERLSSGLRINRAGDDAAGLAISEGLRSQISGLGVAQRNANDGISLVQTAEGALGEVHTILHRLRDLAVQAGNDTNNADSRTAIQTEATELTDELTRIGTSSNFNGIQLLDGSAASVNLQVGADGNAASQITIDLSGADVTAIATSVSTLTYDTAANAQLSITALDTAIGSVSTARATLGASQNRLESTVRTLSNSAENLTAAESRIRDTDVSSEVVKQTRANILSQAGIAMLAQANQSGQNVLQLLR